MYKTRGRAGDLSQPNAEVAAAGPARACGQQFHVWGRPKAARLAAGALDRVADIMNFLGRYLVNIKASGRGQVLRPLRAPDAVEDDEGND